MSRDKRHLFYAGRPTVTRWDQDAAGRRHPGDATARLGAASPPPRRSREALQRSIRRFAGPRRTAPALRLEVEPNPRHRKAIQSARPGGDGDRAAARNWRPNRPPPVATEIRHRPGRSCSVVIRLIAFDPFLLRESHACALTAERRDVLTLGDGRIGERSSTAAAACTALPNACVRDLPVPLPQRDSQRVIDARARMPST